MSLNYKRLYRWLPCVSAVVLAALFSLFMQADLQTHRQVDEPRPPR